MQWEFHSGGGSTLKQIWLNTLASARWDSLNPYFPLFLANKPSLQLQCNAFLQRRRFTRVTNPPRKPFFPFFLLFSSSFYEIRIEPSISGGGQFRK